MEVGSKNDLDRPNLSDRRLKRALVVAFATKSMLVMPIPAYSNVEGSKRDLSKELRS